MNIKLKILIAHVAFMSIIGVSGKVPPASTVKYETGVDGFTDAHDLTVVGQAVALPNYHRIDVSKYPNLTTDVKNLLKNGAGIAVMFKTNSPKIQVRWTTGLTSSRAYVNPILEKGMDLYIKQNNDWVWAGVARKTATTTTAAIVENMDNSDKECILYLPVYEEVTDLKIGVDPGATLVPIPSPFKGKVVMYGTSIMQGAAASRPGMAYPARLCRQTGINFINLGLSGNGTMPTADADMIADLDADAYIMDCTQNGTVAIIQNNTAYMVNKIRTAHPNAPIIMKAGETRIAGNFDETRRIYWGNVYAAFKTEYTKLVAAGVQNLHWIDDTGFYGSDREAVVDGTHPTDVGFTRMINILRPQFLSILSTLPVFQ
jgi:lysophospholipase L1-like esterase